LHLALHVTGPRVATFTPNPATRVAPTGAVRRRAEPCKRTFLALPGLSTTYKPHNTVGAAFHTESAVRHVRHDAVRHHTYGAAFGVKAATRGAECNALYGAARRRIRVGLIRMHTCFNFFFLVFLNFPGFRMIVSNSTAVRWSSVLTSHT